MINKKNMGYEGEFWFGQPAQKMQVIFDTGSCWVWLYSQKCTPESCPPKNKRYQDDKSKKYHVDTHAKQMLSYGRG